MFEMKESSIENQTVQFAKYFTEKDADGIGTLLSDRFSLYDPALKWVHGKDKVVQVLRQLFRDTDKVSYEVIRVFSDDQTGILEFKITLNDQVLYGVDFMEWENGLMTELRCYYNPPDK